MQSQPRGPPRRLVVETIGSLDFGTYVLMNLGNMLPNVYCGGFGFWVVFKTSSVHTVYDVSFGCFIPGYTLWFLLFILRRPVAGDMSNTSNPRHYWSREENQAPSFRLHLIERRAKDGQSCGTSLCMSRDP